MREEMSRGNNRSSKILFPKLRSPHGLARQAGQLGSELLDEGDVAAFVSETGELFFLVGQLSADLVEAAGGSHAAPEEGADAGSGAGPARGGGAVLRGAQAAGFHLFLEMGADEAALAADQDEDEDAHGEPAEP